MKKGQEMDGTFLAIVDADRIQDYIFAPRQLKLIRGASAIQREVNLTYSLDLLNESSYGPGNLEGQEITGTRLDENPGQRWEVVYAGGGNLYVLFRDGKDADRFVKAACALYRKHGATATASGAIVPWTGTFRATLEQGQERVMARKTSNGQPGHAVSGPYWKFCEACGLHPASHWSRYPVTGEHILCQACYARRRHSERAPYLDEIAKGLKPPQDFEEIAEAARPDGYLALVYLDVDRLGRFFEGIDPLPPELYRYHSLHIRKSVREAVIEGCRATCATGPADGTARFEVLLLGGDDAIVVMASQYVFEFLRRFRKAFGSKLPNLTFSAGVVWAHHHLPVSQYVYHAKKLLRSAKAAGGNRVDYLVVSESMVRGLEGRKRERTLRPYEFPGFEGLAETIRAWKADGFPSNKVHQLYGMAFHETNQASLDFLYWISRLEERHKNLACNFFREGIWREKPWRSTGAADLAELWSFVEG